MRSGRPLLVVVALVAAFALGVAARGLAPTPGAGRTASGAAHPPASETGGPSSCVDPRAMAANATLVTDSHACHAALVAAKSEGERASALAASRARTATTLLDTGMSPEDWSRAARTGAVVLRTPCASHRERRSVEVIRPSQRRFAGGPLPDTSARAEAAGLSAEELTAVEDAYTRAHERTWSKLKTACAALDSEEEEREREEAPTFARITRCRHLAMAKVDLAAVGRLAELRSAGHAPARATRPEDGVLLALVESQEELARALTEAIGTEKATRAVAFGVTCSQETFLFAPPPPSQPT